MAAEIKKAWANNEATCLSGIVSHSAVPLSCATQLWTSDGRAQLQGHSLRSLASQQREVKKFREDRLFVVNI